MALSITQGSALAVGGLALANAAAKVNWKGSTQTQWNNLTVEKVIYGACMVSAVVGTANAAWGIFGLMVPFTYDSPRTFEPDGLATYFASCANEGLILMGTSFFAAKLTSRLSQQNNEEAVK